MKFKIFGFKGELSTSGRQKPKKKTKEDKDEGVVGVGFKAYSEFEASTSRFQKPSQVNGSVKTDLSGTQAAGTKPKDWGGTKVATQKNKPPPPPARYNANDTNKKETKPILKKPPEAQASFSPVKPETPDQNHEKSTLISMTENKDDQPIYDDIQSVKKSSDGKKFTAHGGFDGSDESEDEFGGKTTMKPAKVEVHETPQSDNKNTGGAKQVITLGGFDDEDSEDEFGGKKSRKTEEKSAKNAQTGSDFGYSDQAASIFFRSDSPEPEQRVRNFSIKKGGYSDEEDNTSQTSA